MKPRTAQRKDGWMRQALENCVSMVLALILAAAPAHAQVVSDEAAIRAALAAQTAAWNRADIPAFMQTYENSPDTTFIRAKLRKATDPSWSGTPSPTPPRRRWARLPSATSRFACFPALAAASSLPWSPAVFTSNARPKAMPKRTMAFFRLSGAKVRKVGRFCSTTPARTSPARRRKCTLDTPWTACFARSLMEPFPPPPFTRTRCATPSPTFIPRRRSTCW
jgi:hypothetical protein